MILLDVQRMLREQAKIIIDENPDKFQLLKRTNPSDIGSYLCNKYLAWVNKGKEGTEAMQTWKSKALIQQYIQDRLEGDLSEMEEKKGQEKVSDDAR